MAVTVKNSAIVAAIVASITTASLTFWMTVHKEKQALCETRQCINAASRILNAMDASADPCNSFYQFACGRWLVENPIPDDKSSVNTFNLLVDDNKKKLKAILNSDYSEDRTAIKKAKIFYRSCMNEDAVKELDAKPALDLVDKFGGMPLFDGRFQVNDLNLEKYLAKTKNRYRFYFRPISSPLVALRVSADDKNSSKNVIVLDQPHLGMPSRDYYIGAKLNSSLPAYKEYMHDYLRELWLSKEKENADDSNYNEQELIDAVDEIVKLEKELAEILEPDENRLDVVAIYNKLSLKEMSEKITPKFDWHKFVKSVMARVDYPVTKDTEVVFYAKPYFTKFMDVLEKYNGRTLKNYVIWINLNQRINHLSKRFRDTQAPYRKAVTGTSVEEDRWKICVESAKSFLPFPVGAIFVKALFSDESKEVLLEMINKTLEFFKSELPGVTWMDDQTREAASVKVDAVGDLIGYPDYILDENDAKLDTDHENFTVTEKTYFENAHGLFYFHLDKILNKVKKPVIREEFDIGPAVVNAFYDPNRNIIAFPAGILQPPFYDAGRPFAMNYGAIGHAIGHEITHGFDTTGASYDGVGNLVNWWSNSSYEQFQEKSQCLRDQYSGFFYETAGMFVNGNLTIGENIADIGGLRATFGAYQMWKEDNLEKEFRLPGLEEYTPEQLFFISNGQVWCSAERPEIAKQTIATDYHSPSIFRVEGTYRNLKEFGEAFGCKRGEDIMFPEPEDTCKVW